LGAAWATVATEAFLTVALLFGLRKKRGKVDDSTN
jgi:Na+-driven multidrug efflux pump